MLTGEYEWRVKGEFSIFPFVYFFPSIRFTPVKIFRSRVYDICRLTTFCILGSRSVCPDGVYQVVLGTLIFREGVRGLLEVNKTA